MEFEGGNANDVFDYEEDDDVLDPVVVDPFCAGFNVAFALFYAPKTT